MKNINNNIYNIRAGNYHCRTAGVRFFHTFDFFHYFFFLKIMKKIIFKKNTFAALYRPPVGPYLF